MIKNVFFILLLSFLTGSFQNGCFDLSIDSTVCNICSFNYYLNTAFDWNSFSFPPPNCVIKQNSTFEIIIYVNSSSNCSQDNQCDGTFSHPFNNLFVAFESLMVNGLQYINSSVHIYLYGYNSHILYTNKVSNNGFLIFRRYNIQVIIETLLCSIMNVAGCHIDEFSLAEILIKRNDILFFISKQLTLKSLKFNGIDMNAYNNTNDISFKDSNQNIKYCSEEDLNSPTKKNICFLGKNSYFEKSATYGLFNLELLYDDPLFPNPQLSIQNCEFLYLYFINQSSSYVMSLINVLQGLSNTISIENTTITKFFSYKGILNLNQNEDPFYLYVSVSNNLKTISQPFLNLSINNVSITKYNNYGVYLIDGYGTDFTSIFNLHANQTMNLYSNVPTLNILLINSTMEYIINNNYNIGLEMYFIRISGFNNRSNYKALNCDFSNNSYIYFVHIWDCANITIDSSVFQNNNDISFFFHSNPATFSKNFLQNISALNYSLMYVNNTALNLLDCSFINVILGTLNMVFDIQNILVSDSEIMLNAVPISTITIIIKNNVFQNLTSLKLFYLPVIFDCLFINNLLESLFIIDYIIESQGVSNILYISDSQFYNITVRTFFNLNFVGMLSQLLNLIIILDGIQSAIFFELVRNASTIIENIYLKTYGLSYLYFSHIPTAYLTTVRVMNCVFKGGLNIGELQYFCFRNINLALIFNVTFEFEKINSDPYVYQFIIIINYGNSFINTFVNLTNVFATKTLVRVSCITNIYVKNCSFTYPDDGRYPILEIGAISKTSFALINSNFSNTLNFALSIGVLDKIMNLFISNCNFYQITGISLSFSMSDSDFIIENLLNGQSDQFYNNYYPYCNSQLGQSYTSFDTPSYEFCLNFSKTNQTIFSVEGVEAFNMSEWSFIFLNNFGIINSTFIEGNFIIADFLQIIHLDESFATNMLFKGCLFKNRDLPNADFIKVTSYSVAIIDCIFENFSSVSGGNIFKTISSKIIIMNTVFKNINSVTNGAIFYMQLSDLLIYNCSFQQINSINQGSVFYLLEVNSNISYSAVNDSHVVLEGGHLYAEGGELIIMNSDFMVGSSEFFGGSLYITGLDLIFISNSLFRKNSALKGCIFIEGISTSITYQIYNVSFEQNSGDQGSCLYVKDANINLKMSIFEENTANFSFIFFSSSFLPYNLTMENVLIENNTSYQKGIYLEKSNFILNSSNFKNNIFSNNFVDIISSPSTKLFHCSFVYNVSALQQALYSKQILFSADTSTGLFENINITAGFYSSCLILTFSNFAINNSNFEKCMVAINVNTKSSLILTFSTISENIGSNSGAGIFLSDSSFIGLNSLYKKNSANLGSDIYFKNSGSILMMYSLKDLSFIDFNQNSIYFSGNFSITLDNLIFYQNSDVLSNQGSQAILGEDFNNISIYHCSFNNLKHMSALVFSNTKITQMILINIDSSNFTNCSSDTSGGAISLSGNMTLSITQSEFKENTAETNGGAIYYDCEMCYLDNFYLQLKIQNNKFIDNSCKISGGAIKALDLNKTSLINENEFKDNYAQVGSDMSTKPHKLYLSTLNFTSNNMVFNFSNSMSYFIAASGHSLSFTVFLLDKFDNFLIDEVNGNIQITNANASDSSLKLLSSNQNLKNDSNGKLDFNIPVIGKLKNSYVVNISYTYGNIEIIQDFTLYLRSCIAGEYQADLCQLNSKCDLNSSDYINTQCVQCNLGFYSLNPRQECTLCVNNANCPGGNEIFPIEGFWRFDENSQKIIKCNNALLCPDQIQFFKSNSTNFATVCGAGSFGKLCSNCENGYGISSDKACLICQANAKVIILAIFNFLILLYQSLVVFNVKREQSISRSLMKLMVNHTNYVTLLTIFSDTIFSDKLNLIFSLKDQVSTVGTITDGTITDCLINMFVEKENLVIARIAIFSFYPIIIFVILCLVRFLLIFLSKLIKKNKKNKSNLKMIVISCLILVIYSFYPKLVYNAFSLLKCISLDDTNKLFLEINPNIQCWENDHVKYILSIFLPNLLIYCLGWPLLLFLMLYRKKLTSLNEMIKSFTETSGKLKMRESSYSLERSVSKKNTKKTDYKFVMTQSQEDDIFKKDKMYSSITIDYVPQTYYWDSFFFGTNLVLISISVASDNFPQILYIGIILSIFFFMLLISKKIQPFRFFEINDLMNFSFITIIVTFFCVANITFLNGEHIVLENIYFAIIFILNGIFYLYWLQLFVQNAFISKIYETFQKIKEKKQMKENSNSKKPECVKTKLEEIDEEKKKNQIYEKVLEIEEKKSFRKITESNTMNSPLQTVMDTIGTLNKPEKQEKIPKKIHEMPGDEDSVYDE